jgi:hypothetical protein
MPKLDIEFAWPVAVAGYEPKDFPGAGTFLVARGDEERWDNPVAFNPALFRQFAALPETPAACADFASKFGLLFGVGLQQISSVNRGRDRPPVRSFVEDDRDSIDEWIEQIRRFRRLVNDWDRARSAGEDPRPNLLNLLPPPALIVRLVDREGKPSLSLSPDCLLSAMDLQFYQAVAGMTELRACEQCGTWFECGTGGGRRIVSRFCSNRCRFNFHNDRRSKGDQQ